MSAHPLAYLNYLRFFAIVRQREHFQASEVEELHALQEQEGFVDSQGEQWCLGSLIGKAWIERHYEIRSLANALETLENVAPQWATPKALAWMMAATWEPKGDTPDPTSLHYMAVQDILEKEIESLGPDQWLAVGREAMGILSGVWEKGSTLNSASRTAERHCEIWLEHSLRWAEGKFPTPLATHPAWPQWVADKTVQAIASIRIFGMGAESVKTILSLEGSPAAQVDGWVGAWTQMAEHTHRLFQASDNHPKSTAWHRMWNKLLPAVTGMFCLMAHNHSNPESDSPALREILAETSDRLEGWEHGVVPYTEREGEGVLYDRLRAQLQEARMGFVLAPGVEAPNGPGRPMRL